MDPEAALAVCRVVHDTAAMLLWGAFVFLATLVPRDLADHLARRLRAFRLGAIAIAAATALAAVPIEIASIGTGWGAVLDPATATAVLADTSVGHALLMAVLAALLLIGTQASPPRMRTPATAAGAGLLLGSLCLTGHAAMHEGVLGLVHRLDDLLHVLAAGAWLGALLPLLLILRALDDPPWRTLASLALRRFSSAGHGAVALALASGAGNAALVLGRWPTDRTSPYQMLLAAKIAVVGAMVLLALFNRYVVVPRLGRDPAASLRTLRRATVAAIGLGGAAIACVGVFGLLEPSVEG